jgi:hypothetical protein
MTTHQQAYEQIYKRQLKCIYGCPREISNKKVPPQAKILVIEMNNDENKIMGIGEIINQTASELYKPVAGGRNPPFNQSNEVPAVGGRTPPAAPLPFRKIFSDRNYTRYIYIGNTRYASREELERNHTPDAQYINKQLEGLLPQQQQQQHSSATAITQIELLLFKGARHMKRGSGITRCPFATTQLYNSSSLEKTKRSSLST